MTVNFVNTFSVTVVTVKGGGIFRKGEFSEMEGVDLKRRGADPLVHYECFHDVLPIEVHVILFATASFS